LLKIRLRKQANGGGEFTEYWVDENLRFWGREFTVCGKRKPKVHGIPEKKVVVVAVCG
jgi:hypothetical protein